jgi:hypothetical protein
VIFRRIVRHNNTKKVQKTKLLFVTIQNLNLFEIIIITHITPRKKRVPRNGKKNVFSWLNSNINNTHSFNNHTN